MRVVGIRQAAVFLTLLIVMLAAAAQALTQGVTPQIVTLELSPGESATVTKTVLTGRIPPNADFVFLADTTSSMNPSLEDVKDNSQAIIDAIEAAGASDARYGVGNYRDFFSATTACDYGFELDTNLTTSTAAKAAIETWAGSVGCDLPEANFYGLHKVAVHDISWRPGSARFVIWFGDAPGHEPVCDALAGYSDPHTSITEASVTADLVGQGIRVIAVTAATPSAGRPGLDADPKPISIDYPPPCAADETGTAGQATRIATATTGVHLINPTGVSISSTIIAALNTLPPIPVTVTPLATCEAGLVVTNAPPSQVVPSGSAAVFQETITFTGTAAGLTLQCTVDFLINGSSAGPEYVQEITVQTVAGPPAFITLLPATDTNPVGDTHCVTATVTDAFGNPVPGATVNFTAGPGATPPSDTATTNSSGQAEFCFTGPALPATVTITAAVAGTALRATATKIFALPPSTEGCKVTYGGRITAANGDKATFGGNAKADGLSGQEEYQDHGPAADINVHSIDVLSVDCSLDGTQASIFGTATINGSGTFDYRIDLKDLAEPGSTDTYRIRLSNGYDSGEQTLNQGNVQIHK